MTRYQQLMQRIHTGECILLDGATGTELERRGVPKLENAWNGGGALSHPDILRTIHEDYLRLGAEIIISNHFATHYHALQDAGEEAHFEAYNRRGVELALEARNNQQTPNALVASGISYWAWSGNHPSLEALDIAARHQVAILANAGTELLLLEMMVDIDRMLILLDAAQSTGLPVWVGFSCKLDEQGTPLLLNGEPLVDALSALQHRQIDLINIMHTEVGDIDACLDVLQAHWSGPVGVYAHKGDFIEAEQRWIYDCSITPADYCHAAEGWIRRGVSVIGGCCGIEPRHIEALATFVQRSAAPSPE